MGTVHPRQHLGFCFAGYIYNIFVYKVSSANSDGLSRLVRLMLLAKGGNSEVPFAYKQSRLEKVLHHGSMESWALVGASEDSCAAMAGLVSILETSAPRTQSLGFLAWLLTTNLEFGYLASLKTYDTSIPIAGCTCL